MRKTLTALSVATALTFGTIAPAVAQETPATDVPASTALSSDENTESSAALSADSEAGTDASSGSAELSAEPVGETNLGTVLAIVGGIAGVFAVAGLIAAGVNWAVQTRMIPNPLPGIIPNPTAPRPAPAPAPRPAPAPAPQPAPAPAPRPAPAPAPRPAPAPAPSVYYQNCTDVWNRIGRPIRSYDAGYRSGLDRDGDGVGCERDPR